MGTCKEKDQPNIESFIDNYARHRELMREKTKEVFSAEGGPTLDGLTELFELGQGLPVPDFTQTFEAAKKRNTPEYREALAEVNRLSCVE